MMRKALLITMLPASRLPLAQEADDVMEHEDFREYANTHGYHFTDKAADYATKKMKNANGTEHNWTTQQVRTAFKDGNMSKPDGMTCGDVAYIANYAYAKFFPTLLKTETDCLKYANILVNDADVYNEVAFMMWISDLIGKGIKVEWSNIM